MALLKEGDLPLVSARNVNNGVKGFVGNPTKIFSGGNVITLNIMTETVAQDLPTIKHVILHLILMLLHLFHRTTYHRKR